MINASGLFSRHSQLYAFPGAAGKKDGIGVGLDLILICFHVETNYPGPGRQASQRLGVVRQPWEAGCELTNDRVHGLEDSVGKLLFAQLIPDMLLGVEFR